MAKQKHVEADATKEMFPLKDIESPKPLSPSSIEGNVWTRHKAQLIARYLYSFLSVTKNGIYLDAFAGPQTVGDREQSWAALRLLEKQSIFLNRACLFEQDPSKIPFLEELKTKYCQGFRRLSNRQVMVFPGDCNKQIPIYLKQHKIKPKKAAFALLDQRTHECSWDLVKTLANHKTGGNKVEIFYFLAQGWMNRSIKSSSQPTKISEIDSWWGDSNWNHFVGMKSFERATFMEGRFKNELGYEFARAFPMKDYGNDGKIMFWLIHASDHPRANPLMISAYRSIGLNWTDEEWEQIHIDEIIANLGNDASITCGSLLR